MKLSGTGLVALTVLSGPLSGQDKETLWTQVEATQNRVVLRWDKRHPWNNDFGGGRGLELVARYRGSSGQAVVESVTSGSVDVKDREANFTLPERVRGAVHSPICLFFRMNGRALPIRRANKGDRDTAGFRYPMWEARLRQQSKTESVRRMVSDLEGKLEVVRGSVQNQKQVIAQFGWNAYPRCEEMPARAVDVVVRPRTVVDPQQQAEVAAKVCVHRVWTASIFWEDAKREVSKDILEARNETPKVDGRLLQKARERFCGLFNFANDLPELAQLVRKAEGAEQALGSEILRQAEQVERDWKQHRIGIESYLPQFGKRTDYLDLPSAATEASCRRNGRKLAAELGVPWVMEGISEKPTDLAGWIGGVFDSYFICLEDTRKGLAIEYERWVAAERTAPQRAALRHADLVKMCRQDQETLRRLSDQQSKFESALQEARAELNRYEQLPDLADKSVVLNEAVCSGGDGVR